MGAATVRAKGHPRCIGHPRPTSSSNSRSSNLDEVQKVDIMRCTAVGQRVHRPCTLPLQPALAISSQVVLVELLKSARSTTCRREEIFVYGRCGRPGSTMMSVCPMHLGRKPRFWHNRNQRSIGYLCTNDKSCLNTIMIVLSWPDNRSIQV
ncbi:Hypothetical protein NTJ_10372 [Nesidiocoris tenuis]|uniref:Uncharacterized protein n=1 Tax=Nesidiocoris tenuis TaxID=355587 RepID=A0ABN7AZF4_9HEMI|nr:Hypothetical protein NTJ_10372 [Nesidiocoris tenuis]